MVIAFAAANSGDGCARAGAATLGLGSLPVDTGPFPRLSLASELPRSRTLNELKLGTASDSDVQAEVFKLLTSVDAHDGNSYCTQEGFRLG